MSHVSMMQKRLDGVVMRVGSYLILYRKRQNIRLQLAPRVKYKNMRKYYRKANHDR